MNITEIVADWLKEHGYDGLYNPGVCACKADDLAPGGYGCMSDDCEAGVYVKGTCESCTPEKPCDFHIGPKSESDKNKDTGDWYGMWG